MDLMTSSGDGHKGRKSYRISTWVELCSMRKVPCRDEYDKRPFRRAPRVD